MRLPPCPLPENHVTPETGDCFKTMSLQQTGSLEGHRLKRSRKALSRCLGPPTARVRGTNPRRSPAVFHLGTCRWGARGSSGERRRRVRACGAALPAQPGGLSRPCRGFPGEARGGLSGLRAWTRRAAAGSPGRSTGRAFLAATHR